MTLGNFIKIQNTLGFQPRVFQIFLKLPRGSLVLTNDLSNGHYLYTNAPWAPACIYGYSAAAQKSIHVIAALYKLPLICILALTCQTILHILKFFAHDVFDELECSYPGIMDILGIDRLPQTLPQCEYECSLCGL